MDEPPSTCVEQVEKVLRAAIDGSAGGLARQAADRAPNDREMIATLADLCDAQTDALVYLARIVDRLVDHAVG